MWDDEVSNPSHEDKSSFYQEIARLNEKARIAYLIEQEEEEKERKKNHDFVQFTRKGLSVLSSITNPIALRVFLFLSEKMDRENKIIVSQQTLAEVLGVSRQSISTAVKELVDKQMLMILKTGSSNIYCLNANVVWTTYGNRKEYATFKATVFISKTEQLQRLKKVRTPRHKHLVQSKK